MDGATGVRRVVNGMALCACTTQQGRQAGLGGARTVGGQPEPSCRFWHSTQAIPFSISAGRVLRLAYNEREAPFPIFWTMMLPLASAPRQKAIHVRSRN